MVIVEPSFFVFGFTFHAVGATVAFSELGRFVSADVDDFGLEDFDGFIDEVLAEGYKFVATGAGLEAGEWFFTEVAAFFDIEESFEVTEEVDEWDDLERGEFALEGLDLGGSYGTFSVTPGG